MDLRYKQHNELLNRILILLHSHQLGRFWSNATGAIKSSNGHFQRYGLKGSSDILGISKCGQFVAIEVKTGSGRLSKEQVNFRKMILDNNGLYTVIRSETEFPQLAEDILGCSVKYVDM